MAIDNNPYSEQDVQALIEDAKQHAKRAQLPLKDKLFLLIAFFVVLVAAIAIAAVWMLAYLPPWKASMVVIPVGAFFLWFALRGMWRAERNKMEQKIIFEMISQKLGLELDRFQMTKWVRFQLLDHLKYGTRNRTRFAVFDYHWPLGKSGGKSRMICQTVVWLYRGGAKLPDFSIGPGSWLSRDIVDLLTGRYDFNFESHPTFTKTHQIRGCNVNAIRELFTEDVLHFYEQHPDLITEVSGNKLLFYRLGVRVERDDRLSFLNEAMQLLALFQPANDEGN